MDDSSIGWLVAAAVLLLLLSVAYIIYRAQAPKPLPARDREALEVLRHGIPAQATILSLSNAGTRYGQVLCIGVMLRLKVHGASGAPAFEAETTVFISLIRIPDFGAGKQIKVRADPARKTAAVDMVAMYAPDEFIGYGVQSASVPHP